MQKVYDDLGKAIAYLGEAQKLIRLAALQMEETSDLEASNIDRRELAIRVRAAAHLVDLLAILKISGYQISSEQQSIEDNFAQQLPEGTEVHKA